MAQPYERLLGNTLHAHQTLELDNVPIHLSRTFTGTYHLNWVCGGA